MRISDWSSDVCSSDLALEADAHGEPAGGKAERHAHEVDERGGPAHLRQTEALTGHQRAGEWRNDADLHRGGKAAQIKQPDHGRSEERRGGKGGVMTGCTQWAPDH